MLKTALSLGGYFWAIWHFNRLGFWRNNLQKCFRCVTMRVGPPCQIQATQILVLQIFEISKFWIIGLELARAPFLLLRHLHRGNPARSIGCHGRCPRDSRGSPRTRTCPPPPAAFCTFNDPSNPWVSGGRPDLIAPAALYGVSVAGVLPGALLPGPPSSHQVLHKLLIGWYCESLKI